MGKAVPAQHPAVVLRSHFTHLRAMLAIAAVAILGLTAAVVILATNDDNGVSTSSSAVSASPLSAMTPQEQRYADALGSMSDDQLSAAFSNGRLTTGTRYDGGPEEGTRGIVPSQPPTAARYDGGPEEGTRGILGSSLSGVVPSQPKSPGTRYDGGPEEGTRGVLVPAGKVPGVRYDGGPEEGSRGPGAHSN